MPPGLGGAPGAGLGHMMPPSPAQDQPHQLSLALGDPSSLVSTLSLQTRALLSSDCCGHVCCWYRSLKSCPKGEIYQQAVKSLVSSYQFPNLLSEQHIDLVLLRRVIITTTFQWVGAEGAKNWSKLLSMCDFT